MKIKILAATLVLFSAQGLAGVPEFDAVGDDSNNLFNDFVRDKVVEFNKDGFGEAINTDSDFTDHVYIGDYFHHADYFREGFRSSGTRNPDPCFNKMNNGREYTSRFAGVRNHNWFQWDIVLQMKPESDLDIIIRDCVLVGGTKRLPMENASQTGRFQRSNGALVFHKPKNPTITVLALPGPHNHFKPFYLQTRLTPTLSVRPLYDTRYTSKAVWTETIVAKMPEDAKPCRLSVEECATIDSSGTVRLREGDLIEIWVDIPGNNPNDIYYGPDNVAIEYVGEWGTWLTAPAASEPGPL